MVIVQIISASLNIINQDLKCLIGTACEAQIIYMQFGL